MRIQSLVTAAVLGAAAAAVAWVISSVPGGSAEAAALAAPQAAPDEPAGPGPVTVDLFHPERAIGPDGTRPPLPEPAFGGSVSVHVDVLPPSLCVPIENSADARRILYEVHETLMRQDWETWAWEPSLCEERFVEDALVLLEGGRVWGRVTEEGGEYAVTPAAPGNPLGAQRRYARDSVRSIERATVYTYRLREDVLWHPAEGIEDQRLDARDVAFSFSIYANPHVRCDEKRWQFEGVECAVVDARTVRFVEPRQSFRGDQNVADMTILPSHLYDLSDPDNPGCDPDATAEEQARAVHESAHNREWVGVGPYRVVAFGSQAVEAVRFEGYFDPARAGFLDRIRWRQVGDAAAFQALLEEEIDFTPRLSSDDYLGRAGEAPFTKRFYKGYAYRGIYGALVWNLHRPVLADPAVRLAIAHAFDFEGYRRAFYKGFARQVTGPMPFFSPAYDASVLPYPYDPGKAEALLDEAGWYDRDGDLVRDRDGVALAIEYLMPSGSVSSRTLGLKLQEDLARIGIDLALRELEWAALRERQKRREFDATPMGWYQPLEPDPEQLWHSKNGAPGVESSNHAGLQDAEVDRLIEAGQRETDTAARTAIWHLLHRRIYELQPCLFLYNVPVRFAMQRSIRGFQAFQIDPGYSIRRWHYAQGTPGTRAAREAPGPRGTDPARESPPREPR